MLRDENVSMRWWADRWGSPRRSAEEARAAAAELELRNEDLRELLELAGGLAARANNRDELVGYAERRLAELLRAESVAITEPGAGEIDLRAGDGAVASILIVDGTEFDSDRWERLRGAVVPHLATALESAELADRVRRTHLDTILALSRSIEAKDNYTGGHTERVSEVAVALGERLGFTGLDLHSLEIGALLHDIGKIGIPERILHKQAPLDDEEWRVMREHPVISDYILSEVDLPPLVRECARWSHERYDGAGYPDGRHGDDIPLAARIVHVADAFDALTSDRPYRKARATADALDEIRANAGTQFCPRVVAALDDLAREQPYVLGGPELRVVSARRPAAGDEAAPPRLVGIAGDAS